MKTRYLLIGFVCALALGCQKPENTSAKTENVWGKFAKSVLAAGKAKDADTFVNKLSMSSVADLDALLEELKKANPEVEFEENAERPTDAEIRKEAEANVRLFMNSYADVFDGGGELFSVITAQFPETRGTNIYSLIIWAKQSDGKFRGIKVDSVWKKDDGTIKVMTWTQLSGYEASKGAISKKAILERDTAEACNYPEWIQYKTVFTDPN
ncbi:MAG: hypothetical protein WC711_01000 [Candidatus Staskawiczbacteria bacterium]|jgi:hypothetical protein